MIYFFENYGEFSAENFLNFLPQNRIKKYEKLKQKRDKENCVIAYILLRKALRDFGIKSFEIETDKNGKPYLKGNENICFNISHTSGGVAVVAAESPVGVDIQDILPLKQSVIDRCFSESEKALITASASPEKEFTRLWTLKESAVKFDGSGIANLKNFSFETNEKSFEKFGKKFTTFERKNLFISVCGLRDFSEIKIIENLEEIL